MTDASIQHGDATSRFAVFTDFDGTLVEIAETPEAISVPADLAEELDAATHSFGHAFAVITGREIADIDRFLHPLQLPVAGAHGAQRRRVDGSLELPNAATITAAQDIARAIGPLAIANPKLLLETKEGSVALHFRQAPDLEGACYLAMEEAVLDYPGFTLVPGKMVIEARPVAFDKGAALRAFMQEEPFAGRIPIFIGDDRTDEDAFLAAQELGGVGIKLGPGETFARMRIADVSSVRALLRGLGQIADQHRSLEGNVPH